MLTRLEVACKLILMPRQTLRAKVVSGYALIVPVRPCFEEPLTASCLNMFLGSDSS